MVTRRALQFPDLDAVLREADSLLARGYLRGGQWSLGQNCEHLARAISGSVQGYPFLLPAPLRWFIRWLYFGKIQRREVIVRRVAAPKFLQPPASLDDQLGVEHLREAIHRFQTCPTLHPSPIFGTLTRDEWNMVHLWHCEHHFSFLHPRE